VASDRSPDRTAAQDRGYTADLLRELAERAQERISVPGSGDDALVMEWLAFDGELYRVTIERLA